MEDSRKKLLSYAYNLLARQDYSEYKLRQKLNLKAEEKNLVDEVIETIKGQGFLKEDNYRLLKIKTRLRQGKGKRIIQEELSSEKLSMDESHIEEAYLELGLNPEEILESLVEKKLRRVNIEELDFEGKLKLKNKILSFLVRNGHSFEQGKKILKKYITL